MDLNLYGKLMSEGMPDQQPHEWLMFLEVCSTYLEKHKIKNPVVVELGLLRNRQKKFWTQLFGAEHIGIDISENRAKLDIIGDSHDPKTLKELKGKLKGRPINILFIDADHSYESVKKDFEMYSPLCENIVAFHDIEKNRNRSEGKSKVWKFWDELREIAFKESRGYEKYTFLSICGRNFKKATGRCLGIGVIVKK